MLNKEAARAVELGIIQKSLGDFSMKEFADRLKLQKSVYLLQEFGVELGYDFSWYFRGPYCSRLAKVGFDLETIYSSISKSDPTEFMNSETASNFTKFTKFVKPIIDDTSTLELLSSLHIIKKTHTSYNDDNVINYVTEKKPHFSPDRCKKGLDILREWGLW